MSKNEVKRGVLQRLLRGATEITKWRKSIMSGKVKRNKEYDASEVQNLRLSKQRAEWNYSNRQ